jgi:hypothetical protein
VRDYWVQVPAHYPATSVLFLKENESIKEFITLISNVLPDMALLEG